MRAKLLQVGMLYTLIVATQRQSILSNTCLHQFSRSMAAWPDHVRSPVGYLGRFRLTEIGLEITLG